MKLYTDRIYTLKEAYQAIHDFFSTYHLHEALEDLNRIYTWSCKEKYYKKTAPGNILFHSQQLHRLFSAAEIISYSTGKKISPLTISSDFRPTSTTRLCWRMGRAQRMGMLPKAFKC